VGNQATTATTAANTTSTSGFRHGFQNQLPGTEVVAVGSRAGRGPPPGPSRTMGDDFVRSIQDLNTGPSFFLRHDQGAPPREFSLPPVADRFVQRSHVTREHKLFQRESANYGDGAFAIEKQTGAHHGKRLEFTTTFNSGMFEDTRFGSKEIRQKRLVALREQREQAKATQDALATRITELMALEKKRRAR
jgi:hypothetical protein